MAVTPLVSVVVPIFNGLPYLIEAIDSVLAQTYSNVELVLVDGGSSDGSREWVEAFDHPRVIKDYLPKGTPAAGTWTRACELATGEYVKLLCQDDLLHPMAIAMQVTDLEKTPSAGLAIAQRDIIDAHGKVLSKARGCAGLKAGRVNGVHALEVGAWKGTNIFGEPVAVLFRSSYMRDALPWVDEQPFLLDMFFYAKILKSSDAVVRLQSIGAFRISSSSWSTRLVKAQRQQFIAWQRHVERDIAPQPWYRIAQARISNEKTTQMRRAAYTWLRLQNNFAKS
jgi:glycosyltransferase involved in cell wall biosynthesis